MTEYVLYATPGTCARVPMTALEQAGVSYEVRLVRLMTGEQRSPDFLKVNPKGKVPVLVVSGVPLTENVAIVSYLAETYPDAGILPVARNALERFQHISDLCFFSSTIHPIVTRIGFPQRFAEGEEAQRSVHKKSIELLELYIAIAEARLGEGNWWYGDQWSAVDVYLSWVWSRITPNGFPAGDYPLCMRHADRTASVPTMARVDEHEGRMREQLKAEGLASGPPPARS